ncbi:MAG: monovalent cation/H+ antiporter subunit D family protein [Eubacteriales bacterium]|nr:monovalent cation/H+ antiporter subunit D family protein [Eubacteriales bacterium]
MIKHAPAFIVIIPLSMALLAPIMAKLSKALLRTFVVSAFIGSMIFSSLVLFETLESGRIFYEFGAWEAPFGIEYVMDPLNSIFAVLVSFIATTVAVYSREFFREEGWLKNAVYYSLLCLIVTGSLGMVVTGDAFNLYVFLEISSLSTYALIALGGQRGTVASLKYLQIGTVGASFYLLSIGYIYAITGTLNMIDMAERLQPVITSPAVLIAILLMFVGLGIKMALFPLHIWLPDAHSYAPYPLSAYMSGILIKIPVYVMIRFMFYIFNPTSEVIQSVLNVVGILASIAILFGSIMAIAQSEYKRMLAYSSVAGIGYIALGISIGNIYGLVGAVFHVLNHAFMKVALFFIAGGIYLRCGEKKIENFKGLFKEMPVSMYAFLILAFSMVGIPPTAGFFSKWYLINGAIMEGLWLFPIVIIISSILNAVYFFRIIENIFLKPADKSFESHVKSKYELPFSLLIPISLLSIGVLVLGIMNFELVANVIISSFPEVLN